MLTKIPFSSILAFTFVATITQMKFTEYNPSAYIISIPGLTINGLLVRQEKVPGAAELGKKCLLSFPEIGLEVTFECKGDVAAVVAAKEKVRERIKAIYDNSLA